MTATAYHHIQLDQDGVAWIDGTNTKVVELVTLRLAYDWDADHLQRALPHLTLAQVHSALAYYYDHKPQTDAEIERRLQRADDLATQHPHPELRRKLEAARRSA